MRDGGAWELRPTAWWRRRKVVALFLIPLLLLAVRLVWGWHAARARDGELAAARARGEVATAADVRLPDVPDAENAWEHHVLAMRAVAPGVDSPASSALTYNSYPPFGPAWTKLATASEGAHGAVFARMRQARAFPVARLRTQLPTPGAGLFPGFNQARHLANITGDGALHAHVTGDDAEAVERARDVLHLSRTLRQDPTLISQLVGIGVDALALDRVMTIAPDAHIGPAADGPSKPVTPAQVRALIADLLDERAAWDGFGRALEAERVGINDQLAALTEGTWVIRPLADLQSARVGRSVGTAVEASRLRSRPEVSKLLANRPAVPGQPNSAWLGVRPPPRAVPRYSRWFPVWAEYDRAFETQYRVIAERRAAAVVWAAQLFLAERGRWPQALAELAPAYLPAVPADPFCADGRPLGYVIVKAGLPGGEDRPLVYYEAGLGLAEAAPPDEPTYSYYPGSAAVQRRPVRQYRDFTRFVPPPPMPPLAPLPAPTTGPGSK